MKATKMRNRQLYRASHRTRSNQIGGALSKDLQKKYGKRSVRVIVGDTVNVVRGEYKNISGKIARVATENGSIVIEGIKKEKSQGDKVDVLIHASNVIVTSLNTGDSWRASKLEGKKAVPSQRKTDSDGQDAIAGSDEVESHVKFGAGSDARSHVEFGAGSDAKSEMAESKELDAVLKADETGMSAKSEKDESDAPEDMEDATPARKESES